MKSSTILAAVLLLAATQVQAKDLSYCYEKSYPHNVKRLDANKISVNGKEFTIESSGATDFDALFNNAGLADQVSQKYAAGFTVPQFNQDPGRLRHEKFFDALYGASRDEIEKNLSKVKWLPSGETVSFSSVGGADQALAAVGREIDGNPRLTRLVGKTAGTFYYRKIAGEDKKSAHSYGIAIDFTLPDGLGKYWKWNKCTKGGQCPYPNGVMTNKDLQEVVSIFEKHHFVWGGKWYHFDSVHFEYRPELFEQTCIAE